MASVKISALTAASAALSTDEIAVNEGGTSKKVTVAQLFTAPTFAAGSATAGSWPKMTGGTLLTTAEDGAIEHDATNFYATTDAGNRGYIPVIHFIRADATRTFTSNTSPQVIFTSPANGRLTLEAGLYRFEGMLGLTSMSATSGNISIDLLGAGTATAPVNGWLWQAWGRDASSGTAGGATGGAWMVGINTAADVVTAGVGAALGVSFQGTVEITVAGTLQPTLTMTTAAASILAIGSYIMFERMGTVSVVSLGQWD